MPNPDAPLPDEALGLAPSRGRLVGRKILVVGAGATTHGLADAPVGNGQAAALLAAREGARVACVGRTSRSVDEIVERIRSEGGEAHAVVADVNDDDDCARLVQESADALGGLDGAVLNVGIAGTGAGVTGTSADEWDATMRTNLRAHFVITKALIPLFRSGSASIVYVGSAAALQPLSPTPAYNVSKHGQVALMESIAADEGWRHLRANCVVLGVMDTPMHRWNRRDAAPHELPDFSVIPIGRRGTGWEGAYATMFLLSDEASYITGTTLVVDGGLLLTSPLRPLPRGT